MRTIRWAEMKKSQGTEEKNCQRDGIHQQHRERICLACRNADHAISTCPNDDAKKKVSSAFDVILAGVRR